MKEEAELSMESPFLALDANILTAGGNELLCFSKSAFG
jgi:hypothetical protein